LKREGLAEHVFPGAEVMSGGEFLLDLGEGAEEELADVGECGGVAGRNAIVGEEGEEFSQDVVEVIGGLEVAGEGGELGADAVQFEELLFLASVDKAERGMGIETEHAALAAVGESVLTTIAARRCRVRFGGLLVSFHIVVQKKEVRRQRNKEVRSDHDDGEACFSQIMIARK
jgi:hypothetical protein